MVIEHVVWWVPGGWRWGGHLLIGADRKQEAETIRKGGISNREVAWGIGGVDPTSKAAGGGVGGPPQVERKGNLAGGAEEWVLLVDDVCTKDPFPNRTCGNHEAGPQDLIVGRTRLPGIE
ncbi:hypothetical protein BHM03_00043666 [Ensete ventricosum]|nr:hypothetical protein BHM03_00043666 [Ensete ventricosum]